MNNSNNKINLEEKCSSLFYEVINLLLLKHGVRTSLGLVVGFSFQGLLLLFSPILKNINWVSIENIKIIHLLSMGVLLLHIPTIIKFLFKSTIIDETIDDAFTFMKSLDLTPLEENEFKRKLMNSFIEKLTLNKKLSKQLNDASKIKASK